MPDFIDSLPDNLRLRARELLLLSLEELELEEDLQRSLIEINNVRPRKTLKRD